MRHIDRKPRAVVVWHSKGAIWVEGHGNAGRQLKTDGASQLCISTDTTNGPSVPSGSMCIHSAGMPACIRVSHVQVGECFG